MGVDIDWLLVGAVFGQKRLLDRLDAHLQNRNTAISVDSVDLLLVVEIYPIDKIGRRLATTVSLLHTVWSQARSAGGAWILPPHVHKGNNTPQSADWQCHYAPVGGFAGAGS